MLDLDLDRIGPPPRDAATLILVRERADHVEVFCVERNKKSGFLGGAVVFPGGKLDDADRAEAWRALTTPPRDCPASFAPDADTLRALAIAACRESLEEAAIVPLDPPSGVPPSELLELQRRAANDPGALPRFLGERALRLDLAALYPFARWITPVAEARRFDARFFLARVDGSFAGAHDAREIMDSFWAKPGDVLARFDAGAIQLAPPTHRTLELLASARTMDEVFALAAAQCLDPICPKLVRQDDTLALALPGDPEHEEPTPRVAGKSRFVSRNGRWLPEDPPTPLQPRRS